MKPTKPKSNLIDLWSVKSNSKYSFELKLKHADTIARINQRQHALFEQTKYKKVL